MSRRQVYADHARRRMTMTTKLMVEPSLPRTPLPLRLIQFMADKFHYRHACLFDFLDCNKPLIPFFNKYGYVSYLGWVFHREYGTVRPMFCPACDVEHLSATGSPFLRAVKKYNVSHCVTSQRLRTLLAKA